MEIGSDHKVKPESLNREEAEAFIDFLQTEIIRHKDAIEWAEIEVAFTKPPLRTFWEAAIIRHQIDLEEICRLIHQVKERFELCV